MRFLFVKPSQSWPRVSGHDVHGYHMMRALTELGHEVALSTRNTSPPEAVAGLSLAHQWTWEASEETGHSQPLLRGWQERFRSYWGIEEQSIRAVGRQAEEWSADVVVVVGLEVLPLLGAVKQACRVWYAADEWVWHHLSVLRLRDRSTWSHAKTAVIKGAYEFAYRTAVDRTWVVSAADRRAMRWLAGYRHVDVIPNGVDTDFYQPIQAVETPKSCVFWGRLDFEPNIQALQWFCTRIWPQVRQREPNAEFRIFGFHPTPEVEQFANANGIRLFANLPDLRERIAGNQVVVLPFQSGGGIKNKLLEAASMAKPVLCSRRACNGLVFNGQTPLIVADNERQWVTELVALWGDSDRRHRVGGAARQWVLENHAWQQTARQALAPLEINRS